MISLILVTLYQDTGDVLVLREIPLLIFNIVKVLYDCLSPFNLL